MSQASHARRAEAAARVRGMYPPLPEIFAALRVTLGAPPSPVPPPVPLPVPPPAPEPVAVAPEPVAEPEPEPEPEPERPPLTVRDDTPAPTDPLTVVLLDAARTATGDAEYIALALAAAAEQAVVAAADAGARAARAAGVPSDRDVSTDSAIDAVAAVLAPYAAEVAAAPDDPPPPPPELLARLRGIARSAGVVEAVRGTEWSAVQRFGYPWCPRQACYGRNGSLLTESRIAAEGYPPYGDGCNCVAEPANLP